MQKTEGFRILDAQNAAIPEDKEKKALGMHNQNVVRRKLADITNQAPNRKPLIREKSQCIETTAKEYINQLQKENMALVKILAQRNKILEHNEIELDRVKANMLKVQEQNQQLAMSNAQMLVELNSGKDRLKMLQHELGCRTAILKKRKSNLNAGRETTPPFANADAEKLIKSQEEMESLKEEIHDEKLQETTRNLRHNGVWPSEQVEYKEKTEYKRLSLRRQSARFTVAEVKHVEDLFETNNTIVSASQLPEDSFGEQGSMSVSAVVKNEDSTDDSGQQIGKSSLLRPSRAAAKKVQSYKEVPINVKLRRPE